MFDLVIIFLLILSNLVGFIILIFCCSVRSYAAPLPAHDLDRLTRKTFAPESTKKINWVVKMFAEWHQYRNSIPSMEYIYCDLDDVRTITEGNLCFAITRFITEVCKLDRSPFPRKTIYDLVVCLQMHLETMGFTWKLIDDPVFTDVKFTLDNVMKQSVSNGVGLAVCQAKVLSFSDEDFLWLNGYLGNSNPEQLLKTVVFVLGLSCALRAGKEHRELRSMGFNSQITWHVDISNGNRYFTYHEDIGLKTNKGGLKHRKIVPKVVDVNPIANREHCPVRILYSYFCKLPVNRTCPALYLRPVKNFTPNRWYIDRPVGVNKLQNVVKSVCQQAGLEGFYTNHSLRSTAATRMYQSNVSEQVIQEITGHRSLAVCGYKRTSDSQKKEASACIFSEQVSSISSITENAPKLFQDPFEVVTDGIKNVKF